MPGLDTWTPLFSSIVQSSVWGQSPHVKIVWITMLALKDRSGFVESSVSGLARAAVVTHEQCAEALKIFESPDEDSKCKENKGLKIKAVDGGWVVLGHERFQNKMKSVTEKIGNAKRQAKFREKQKKANSGIPDNQNMPASAAYKAKEAAALKASDRGDMETYNRLAAT